MVRLPLELWNKTVSPILENQSTNKSLSSCFLLGEGGNRSSVHSTERLSWGCGNTGVRKAKGERDVQFLSADAVRLGHSTQGMCPRPQTSSQRKFARVFRSKSRPMSPEGSSVSDSSLVALQSSKKQSAFAWPCKEWGNKWRPPYPTVVSTALTEPCPVVKMRQRGQVGPTRLPLLALRVLTVQCEGEQLQSQCGELVLQRQELLPRRGTANACFAVGEGETWVFLFL